jgi:hypothetical protein
MEIKISPILAAVLAAAAVLSIAAALGLSVQKRAAEEEAAGLKETILRLEAELARAGSRLAAARAEQAGTDQAAGAERLRTGRRDERTAGNEDSGSVTNRPARQRESFEERMARMKEEDPEGYEKMIAERQERREQMRYSLAERTASFMDLDTSRLSEEEQANHDLLVEKMARVWELTEQFPGPEEAPDRETMRELFGVMREVQPLLRQERTVMFRQLGYDLGYEESEADAFAVYVEDIIDLTSMRSPFGGGRGGGRGGGDDRGR